MLNKIKQLVNRGGNKEAKAPEEFESDSGLKLKNPKHIAFTIDGIILFSQNKGITVPESYAEAVKRIKEIIPCQIKKNIPIFTYYLLGKRGDHNKNYDSYVDVLTDFFMELRNDEYVKSGKLKISVIGKWYDLPGKLVEAIKSILDFTKNSEHFNLNLCMNYDGQEEIVDACKLLLRQALADKVDISQINKSNIKDNIYSSYFIPPDMIIKNGYRKTTKGLLLWDSPNSSIYFSEKLWPDFAKADLDKAIEYWQNN